MIDHAGEHGDWSRRRACRLLGLDDDRALDWVRRRADGGSGTRWSTPRRAAAVHGILESEREAIVGVFEAWGGVDRSHRKLAHRAHRHAPPMRPISRRQQPPSAPSLHPPDHVVTAASHTTSVDSTAATAARELVTRWSQNLR